MAKQEIQIFGDESTAEGLVTYGLVAFANKQHERDARYAWSDVLKQFGGSGRSRVHSRLLFSGHARQKTEWSSLTEDDTHKFSTKLIAAACGQGAFFSLGVVHLSTWPTEGYPAGLDENGAPVCFELKVPLAYGYGFIAAAAGLQSDRGVMRKGGQYQLFLDPLHETVKLFSDWKAMQILKLFEFTGLKPSKFDEKPLFLDLVDLFAYASGRALSAGNERNKDVCREIYDMTNCVKTDFWWNPGNTMDPRMSAHTGL